ncbi:MAG: alpha-galactosidase [Oscillospiraceae bacterium]|nr:alpha-galactosidase [Oscillospiraceae bacterium]
MSITGSLCYNGKKIILTPGEQTVAENLVADLQYRTVSDNAEFAVLKLKNTGTANSGQITAVKTLDLEIAATQKPQYHSLRGDSKGAESFMPVDFMLTESYHEEPKGGRSSCTTGFPYFDLSYEGKTDVFAIGWTGQWSKDIIPTDSGFYVQIGLCDCDFYLLPGEEVRFPSVLIVHGEDAASARRAFRRTLREEFSPKKRFGTDPQLPVAVQCFDRYFCPSSPDIPVDESWASEQGQIRTVDAAKKIGNIDTFWIDAAWFTKGYAGGVGNYSCSEGFPNGLRPVSDYAHKNGMRFLVWFEMERADIGTEWHDLEPNLLKINEAFPHTLINLGDAGARQRMEENLIRIISEYGIDIYRQDFNVESLMFWRANDTEGRKGITEMKYVDGMYKLWDRLLQTFPDLLIDNCASGGRRLDLETCMRSVSLWRSDTGCHPDSEEYRNTIWNHNQILSLSEYLPYHACAIWEPDAYTVRSTATQGIAFNYDIFNPEFDFERAGKSAKEVQRLKHYWNGDFYPLCEATLDETVWTAYQLALPDSGAVYIFRRDQSTEGTMTFALNAIDSGKQYRLTFTDENYNSWEETYSGQDLLSGLQICIDNPRNSVVITYEEA